MVLAQAAAGRLLTMMMNRVPENSDFVLVTDRRARSYTAQ